jgi:hypothetical protein
MNLSWYNPPTTPFQWAAIAVCLCITAPQGIWIFRDAQKRGRFPWLWGLWGLVSAPLPIILYYLFVIRVDKKRKKNKKQ